MSSIIMLLGSAASEITGGASAACGTSCTNVGLGTVLKNAANTLTYLVGAISVIMIIIGGLRYAISNGDSKQVQTAKDTILYAVIGVIVAIVSYAVINFVIKALT